MQYVALFTRAWIEIYFVRIRTRFYLVALFTRAWIEIPSGKLSPLWDLSPSLRGRGLKFLRISAA